MDPDEPMSLDDARKMFDDAALAEPSKDVAPVCRSLTPLPPQELIDEVAKLTMWAPIIDLRTLTIWGTEWVQYAMQTGPLSLQEWAAWEVGARGCYAAIGVPWPNNIVRVPSPTVGQIAAPLASWWLRNRDRWVVADTRGFWKKAGNPTTKARTIRDTVGAVVRNRKESSAIIDPVTDAVTAAVRKLAPHWDPCMCLNNDQLDLPHFMTAPAQLGAIIDGPIELAGAMSTIAERIGEVLRTNIRADLLTKVNNSLSAIDAEIRVVNRVAVSGSTKAKRGAVARPGRFEVRDHAVWSFFRDVVQCDLPHEAWEFSRVLQAADSAGTWYPFPEVTMVSELPSAIHLETAEQNVRSWVTPDPVRMFRNQRLHWENGPALAWPDGTGIYAWHGVDVPAWVFEQPSVERALKITNAEVRRAAFEVIGWDQLIAALDFEPIDRCPDPGNAPHELLLYDLPSEVSPFRTPVKLLLMTNGSPDRSGTLRKYGETVPNEIRSALEAASWQYGVSPKVYAQIARRT